MAVILAALAIWLGGMMLGWPPRRRLAGIAFLWLAAILVHLLLPDGAALRRAVGGDARVWAILGGIAVLMLGYGALLAALRSRAARRGDVAATEAPTPTTMPAETERYARHIFLPEIGGPGQRLLRDASVLVVGAGGLGAPALMYLAAAGVGRITIVDGDRVERSNLQRQIIHADARVGMPKAASAARALCDLNPLIQVEAVEARLEAENGPALVADHDVVLDGSDNLDTRELVNRLAVAAGKPLVWGALARWEGQVTVFDPAGGGPCLACLYPVRPAPGTAPDCAVAGVVGPLPGVIGATMAVETIKLITGAGQGLRGRLMIHDALYADTRTITVPPRVDCPVCGHLHRS